MYLLYRFLFLGVCVLFTTAAAAQTIELSPLPSDFSVKGNMSCAFIGTPGPDDVGDRVSFYYRETEPGRTGGNYEADLFDDAGNLVNFNNTSAGTIVTSDPAAATMASLLAVETEAEEGPTGAEADRSNGTTATELQHAISPANFSRAELVLRFRGKSAKPFEFSFSASGFFPGEPLFECSGNGTVDVTVPLRVIG